MGRQKEELDKLKIEIEKAMVILEKLQDKYYELTGRFHKMPPYLSTPVHLQNIK